LSSNSARPIRSSADRPSSDASAAFASVTSPSGVHNATPMGALAKALPRSTGGSASTSPVMPSPPLTPARNALWITSVPRTRALHAAVEVEDAKGTRGNDWRRRERLRPGAARPGGHPRGRHARRLAAGGADPPRRQAGDAGGPGRDRGPPDRGHLVRLAEGGAGSGRRRPGRRGAVPLGYRALVGVGQS